MKYIVITAISILLLISCGTTTKPTGSSLVSISRYESALEARMVAEAESRATLDSMRIETERAAEEHAGIFEASNEETRTPRERLVRNTLRISNLRAHDPNSAGGVDLSLSVENTSEKIIKYITITFRAYNAVGDRVNCQIRRSSRFIGQITGPIEPTSQRYPNWTNAWYNYSIEYADITDISIEYMDGTIFNLSAQDILWAQF